MRYVVLLSLLFLCQGAQASALLPSCNMGVAITDRDEGKIAGTLVSSDCPALTGKKVRITLPPAFETKKIDTLRIRIAAVTGRGPNGPTYGEQWSITGMIENKKPVPPQQFPPISVEIFK